MSAVDRTNSVDSQASVVTSHLPTDSNQSSPLVTPSSALSPTGKLCYLGYSSDNAIPLVV